jgi:hypothetical protein
MLPRVVYYRSSALNRLSPLAACARSGDTAGVASLLLKGIKKTYFFRLHHYTVYNSDLYCCLCFLIIDRQSFI